MNLFGSGGVSKPRLVVEAIVYRACQCGDSKMRDGVYHDQCPRCGSYGFPPENKGVIYDTWVINSPWNRFKRWISKFYK